MAKFRIKLIRAYDSSSNGMIGTSIPDLFKPLNGFREIETKNISEVIETAISLSKEYAIEHPTESFMPYVSVVSGRKPRGYDAHMENAEHSKFREWLKVSTD